ncbi:MAG: hypothetical protein ACRC2R_15375 [Xenococcaceae cyanobacterium]
MSNEQIISNNSAIELSEEQLNEVAGGSYIAMSSGDSGSYLSSSSGYGSCIAMSSGDSDSSVTMSNGKGYNKTYKVSSKMPKSKK